MGQKWLNFKSLQLKDIKIEMENVSQTLNGIILYYGEEQQKLQKNTSKKEILSVLRAN